MAVVGTAFRDILLSIKARIIDNDILPDGDCYIAIRMNPPAQDQRKALVIVPLYQTVQEPTQTGAGRCATYKKARINIYYRHATLSDQTYQDDAWTAAENGYYDLIDRLEDYFDLWDMLDDDGARMLTQPMRLVMNNEPRKKYQEHGEGEGMVELEVEFIARRTNPIP